MDEFLSMSREALKELEDYSKVHVVIGNESCDLDSTISALVYAYYLYTIDEDESVLFLPLMQIPRSKFRLRLETVHFLEKIGIEPDILTFYEDISVIELQTKGKLLVTLVDHHDLTRNISDLESSVVKVIDHRPIFKQWPTSVECIIKPVGSCCTLIAEEVLTNPDFPFDGIVNVLLYGTILIDTINMSPEAGKTTDKDTLMIHKLEDTLEEMGVERDTLYEDLNNAKFDLSGLTTSEILDKDMKLIHGNNLIVAMCSVTMEMKELFTRPDLELELKKLSQEKNAEVVIIMTLSNQDGSPTRQLALYSDNRLYRQQINDILVASQSPSLQLELIPTPTDNIQTYSQGNVQASRKIILPIIKGFLTGEPSPVEAINQLQNTVSPGDQGSNSSVIGAMADSGKGESDHEQHILSNETMSPEVMDMFDPFSTQLNTIDNSEKHTKESDLFQEHSNETSSGNQWSDGSVINDINTTKSSDHNNSEVKDNNLTSISTSNDVFNIEPAVTDSSLSNNQHYENNTINNEEDNFELTEDDMYNFGVNTNLGTESPLDYASGANSGQGSKMSSYPVTPPNSYFDTGLMSRNQDLPSFNNSEMVQIIKAKQASMGRSDSENNSDGEPSEPFTPANSYISDNFNTFAKGTNLPSFNNSDLVSKIREKRASLDNASGGETLGVNSFPYTPHNSYVDKSFDQFAAHGFSGPELSKRLSEERFDSESDGNLNNEFSGISTTDALLESAQLYEASKQSDLLSMGLVKSGSSDTESSGDVNSPNEPVVVKNMIPAEHSSMIQASRNTEESLLPRSSLTESDAANNGLFSEIPEKVSEEQHVDDLFKSILNDSDASDSVISAVTNDISENITFSDIHGSQVKLDNKSVDNVVKSQLSEQMSLNQPLDLFGDLSFDPLASKENASASLITQQMSSDQSENLFDDLLGGSISNSGSGSNTQFTDDSNRIATNLSKQLSSDHPENLFDDLLGDSDLPRTTSTDHSNDVASNFTQQMSSDQPEDPFNDLLGDPQVLSSKPTENYMVGSNLTQQMSSDQPEDLYNDLLGDPQVLSSKPTENNMVGSNLTQQMFSDQPEDLYNDLLGDPQVLSSKPTENNMVGSNLTQQMSSDQPEDLYNDLLGDPQVLSSKPTENNMVGSNLTQQMSSDQPEGLFDDLLGDSEVPSTKSMADNVLASDLIQQMLSAQPEDLLNDLVSSEPGTENISTSHLSQQMLSDQQNSFGGSEDFSDNFTASKISPQMSQNLACERSSDDYNAESLFDDLLTNSETKDNVLAINIMKDMSFDNPVYEETEPKLESSTEDNPNELLNDLTNDEDSLSNVVASQISTDMSDEPESLQTDATQLLQDLCEDSQSTNVVASEMADSMTPQSPQSREDAINDTKPQLTDESSFDLLNGLMNTNNSFDNINEVSEETKETQQTNSTGSFGDNFDPNPNAFDPFSSLLSDEPEDNRNIFDPFAPIKSEEDSPNSPTKHQESNTLSSNEESTHSNPFDPFMNVEESMSSQQEQVFDPFSTISTEGEQIVSGFDDNDESSGSLSNNNTSPFSNISDQPEADQIPSSPLGDSSTYTGQNTGQIDTDVMTSTEQQHTESAPKEQDTADDSDVLNFEQSFGSDPSPSFETDIFKESVSSAEEVFPRNIPASNKEDYEVQTLKPNFDGIRNAMVHQPSIQSDLSTSFDFNEGNSETYSDLSPMEMKDRFDLQELIPEEPADESYTQSAPTVVEKSQLGKLIGAELVHQPSIQSDFSTSFEDKSDYMIDSNPVSPLDDNPSNSDDFSKPVKPSELPLQTEEDIMDKSGVYFPESGVKFLQPESDSSLYNESSDNEEVSPSQDVEIHRTKPDNNDMGISDDNSVDNDLVDPAIEEQLLKTSSQLVETAFKEALDIEAAHVNEENTKSEAKPQSLEDEDIESNTTNDNADESISSTKVNFNESVNDVTIEDEQIAEEAIREVAVAFTDELLKEALDSFDEGMQPPANSIIPETEQHTEFRRPPPLNKSSNSLSLETDYLPEMDPWRGNLDIFTGAEHSATISTDAGREVAEGASYRKISCEESPSQQLEILQKLREDAERNRHVEATSEELRQATLDDSLDDSDQSPDEPVDKEERQTNEDIPKSESLYDNLADTPSSEIFEPFPDPVDTEPILTADHIKDNFSSLPETDVQLSNDSSGIEFIENDDKGISADSSDPLNESSTDDFGMLPNSSLINEYQDSASAEMILASGEPSQNQNVEPKVIVQEPLEKIAVEETFTKQNSTQIESGVYSVTESMLDSTNDHLSTSYTSLSDKEKKEVYMTSAGRISIARGESVASTESGMTSLTTDPRLEEEHQQDIVEMTPTPTESKVVNDVIYKDEWQDEELPPMLDGEEVRQRDDSAVSIESPMPGKSDSSDTHTKRKIVPDIDLFNDDVSEDDILDDDNDEDDESNDLEWENDTPVKSSSSEPIEEYTAAEELEDAKRWKVVNVGDKEYRIDLIVIEPYKKVISHGGYYGDGFNALIVFSGCYLPDKRRKDYQYVMEHLFVYVVHTLEELVAEDYMIVYFHGATPKKQSPSFGWLKKCYQMIDRRLKKNLKSLFLVHPTLWLRTVVLMTKPFISSKFSSKLKFVKTLQELGQIIPMQNLNIPDAVKVYDDKIYQSLSTPSTTPSTPS